MGCAEGQSPFGECLRVSLGYKSCPLVARNGGEETGGTYSVPFNRTK